MWDRYGIAIADLCGVLNSSRCILYVLEVRCVMGKVKYFPYLIGYTLDSALVKFAV